MSPHLDLHHIQKLNMLLRWTQICPPHHCTELWEPVVSTTASDPLTWHAVIKFTAQNQSTMDPAMIDLHVLHTPARLSDQVCVTQTQHKVASAAYEWMLWLGVSAVLSVTVWVCVPECYAASGSPCPGGKWTLLLLPAITIFSSFPSCLVTRVLLYST